MLAQRLNKLKEVRFIWSWVEPLSIFDVQIVKNLNAVKPAAYLTGGYYFSVVYHEGSQSNNHKSNIP